MIAMTRNSTSNLEYKSCLQILSDFQGDLIQFESDLKVDLNSIKFKI